ncbi:hypothetical protein Tco_1247106 [Tanacetum coccineum]
MPDYPNFQNPFANPDEQMLSNQQRMQFNQFSQQQQTKQATVSQPQSDQQSFHLQDEDEEEKDEAKNKHNWKNPESTYARRNRLRVTNEEPEHFGEDALPRPPGAQRITKSHRSSNSKASSGSNPTMFQEMMQQQYELDRKAKMEVIEREVNSRINLYNSQKISEDLRVLQIDTRMMDSVEAAIVNAQKARIRALHPPQN